MTGKLKRCCQPLSKFLSTEAANIMQERSGIDTFETIFTLPFAVAGLRPSHFFNLAGTAVPLPHYPSPLSYLLNGCDSFQPLTPSTIARLHQTLQMLFKPGQRIFPGLRGLRLYVA